MSPSYSSHTKLDFGIFEGKTVLEVFLIAPQYIRAYLEEIPDFNIDDLSIDELLERFPGDPILLYAKEKRRRHIQELAKKILGHRRLFDFPDDYSADALERLCNNMPHFDFVYYPN